jgi:hypothetical protein
MSAPKPTELGAETQYVVPVHSQSSGIPFPLTSLLEPPEMSQSSGMPLPLQSVSH